MESINIDDFVDYKKEYSSRLQKLKHLHGDEYQALCPVHNEKNPSCSFNFKTGLWHCHSCDAQGNYITFRTMTEHISKQEALKRILKDYGRELPQPDNNKSIKAIRRQPYSLVDYAKYIGIPVDFLLKNFKLSDTTYYGTGCVKIPYFDINGNLVRNKVRFGKGEKNTNKFAWLQDTDCTEAYLYGVPFLKDRNDSNKFSFNELIIVEGESDVHTLIYNGFCTVGVPGASNYKNKYTNLFNDEGIKEIYIHIEKDENGNPDTGGKIFATKLPRMLYAGGYKGKIYKFSCRDKGAKDPSELYNHLNRNKNDFIETILALVTDAEEIPIEDIQSYNKPATSTDNNTNNNAINIIPATPQYTKYDEKGKLIKKHIDNFKAFLDFLQLTCKYNLLTKEIEISDSQGNNPFFDLDEASTDIASISLEYELNLSNKSVLDFLSALAKKNRYNPVADYLKNNYLNFYNKAEIDLAAGAEITKLFDCLKIEYDENNTVSEKLQRKTLYKTLFVKWLISAYMIAFNNGAFGCAGILVLKGRQGIGKTRFLNTLCVNESWGYDGLCLDPTNKDSVLSATRYWIVELGEIGQTLQKRTLNALKAFITSPMDDIRLPYGRSSARYPRQTAYLGTVNDDRFLRDETGERRYWVIPLEDIKGTETVDINRVWAEVGYLVESKSIIPYLDSAEIDQLNNMNEAFHRGTTEENLLLDRLDLENTNVLEYKSFKLSEIAIYLGLPLNSISALGKAIKRIKTMFPELPIKIPTNNKNRIYKIPPFKNDPFQAFVE